MLEAISDDVRRQYSAEWLALVHGPEERGAWAYGYSILATEDGAEVASAGFKGPPIDGVVEIAYAVEAAHRGKGYATEIASALAHHALTFAEVTCVRAHTLPDGIVSQRALLGSGFSFTGQTEDPDDGVVNRYELTRAAPR